ncbi:hypothetical protein LIER_39903 [Lithospermum erythrorhizon]|uniref:Uncharacterized protein n=1 Tax=Lithospermum erythrorhizon TaxID=34254 RepID=A0AAV3QPQ0_LITER
MHKFGIIYQFLNLCTVVDCNFEELLLSMLSIVKLAYENMPVDPLEIPSGLSDQIVSVIEKILKNFDSEFYAANGIRFGLPSEEDLDFNLWSDYVTLHHQLQLESNSCFPKVIASKLCVLYFCAFYFIVSIGIDRWIDNRSVVFDSSLFQLSTPVL